TKCRIELGECRLGGIEGWKNAVGDSNHGTGHRKLLTEQNAAKPTTVGWRRLSQQNQQGPGIQGLGCINQKLTIGRRGLRAWLCWKKIREADHAQQDGEGSLCTLCRDDDR